MIIEIQFRRNNVNKSNPIKTNKLINEDDKTNKKNLTNRWKTRQSDKTCAQVTMGNNSKNVKQQNLDAKESNKSTIEIL